MKDYEFIAHVQDIATDLNCTAHVLRESNHRVEFCVLPDAENESWAGDLRLFWDADHVLATLEHSGLIGRCVVRHDPEGCDQLFQWIQRELE